MDFILHEVIDRFFPGYPLISPEFKRPRSFDLLDAALARPKQNVFGKDIHKGVFQKAAALMHAIICYHVFVDGNKRTGAMAAFTFLYYNHYQLEAERDEVYEMAKITSQQKSLKWLGTMPDEEMLAQIADWLQSKSIRISVFQRFKLFFTRV